MKKVSQRQAEAAAKAIGKNFAAEEGYGPKVLDRAEYGDGRDGYIVSWEEGPYEWPYNIHGGFDEELFSMIYPEFEPDSGKAAQRCCRGGVKLPKGIVAEAINHYSVGLYRQEDY